MVIFELMKLIVSELRFETIPWTIVVGVIATGATTLISFLTGGAIQNTCRKNRKDASLRNEAKIILSKHADACRALEYLTDRRDGAFFLIIEQFPYDVARRHVDNVFPGFAEARGCFATRLRNVKERNDRLRQNFEDYARCIELEMHDLVEETVDIHNEFVDWSCKLIQTLQDMDLEYQDKVEKAMNDYKVNYREAASVVRALRDHYDDSVTKGKIALPKIYKKINEREIGLIWRAMKRP